MWGFFNVWSYHRDAMFPKELDLLIYNVVVGKYALYLAGLLDSMT